MDTGPFLALVREGMKVFDRLHQQIGTVDRVRMSDDDPSTPEPADDPFIAQKAFAPDRLPDGIEARLLHDGFLRIESRWLLAADRYVAPDQIMSVSGDAVVLTVSHDELMQKH
jgi:hypothetical protein